MRRKTQVIVCAEIQYFSTIYNDFRSLLAAVVGYAALLVMRHFMPQSTSRLYELALLALAGGVWIGVSALVLKLSGSALPDQLLSRFAKANR